MSQNLIRINLGCGPATLPGFDNIDNSPSVFLARHPALKKLLFQIGLLPRKHYETKWPTDILWQDASRRLRYADGSVDRIYSSHFLEHLPRETGRKVLRECRRVLKQDGIFRLVVPDLVFHTQRYLDETRDLVAHDKTDRAIHDRFLNTVHGGYLDRRRSAHFYMYDWPTLRLILAETGFRNVRRCEFQQSADPELARVDNRPDESLYVEMEG